LEQVHNTAGGVSLATENARTVQEDCHRFALQPGAAVVYRVNGSISELRLYSFARNESLELEVSLSTDGENYRRLELERTVFPSGQSVYGYLLPVLFRGIATGADATYLRIALAESMGKPQISVAASENPAASMAPLEISRVEIEYDRFGRRQELLPTRRQPQP
jgi:hypothetical protein